MFAMNNVEGGWEVGHYEPTEDSETNQIHRWVGLALFKDALSAAALVNYLNGGTGGSGIERVLEQIV